MPQLLTVSCPLTEQKNQDNDNETTKNADLLLPQLGLSCRTPEQMKSAIEATKIDLSNEDKKAHRAIYS